MSDRNSSPIDASEGPCLPPSGSRLLLVAFACHPDNSMEERNGWNRALQAASDFDVTVVCSAQAELTEFKERTPAYLSKRLNFVPVSAGTFGDYCLSRELLFYLGYRLWHGKVFEFSKKLHAASPFSIAHMVSVCGYREPGYVWRLDCPFVWGPIGGTSNFPLKFRITWFKKPPYRESLRHYEWADVFAFTRLRDTSGSGLLESLAAGVPIIGMDHQGAADMLTDQCGIRTPVLNPKQSIAAFAQALVDVASDRRRLYALSQGAAQQASVYSWLQREPLVRQCYAASTDPSTTPPKPTKPALVHENNQTHFSSTLTTQSQI